MSKGFNYKKWDNIELSDDESDCHPNIDKDSWFRMKHRARLEREEKEDVEVNGLEQKNSENAGRVAVIKARLNKLKNGQADEDAEFEDEEALANEAKDLESQIAKRNKRIAEVRERRAWNIDNICTVKEEKTIVNSSVSASLRADDFVPTGTTESRMAATTASSSTVTAPAPVTTVFKTAEKAAANVPTKKAVTAGPVEVNGNKDPQEANSSSREKFAVISYNDYAICHEGLLERYSEIRDLEDSKEFLFKHCDILLHEHAQSYMLLSCLEDEMNGKTERMKLVCRQSQILSHITELGVSMGRDPRDVIIPFFRRIQEKEYLGGFVKAVNEFTVRIKNRAVDKKKEMDAERRNEGVTAGPGGLDPYEVLESLPSVLRDAFESQDIERLQVVLGEMDPREAKRWMKLCVDSGLWVPSDQSIFDDSSKEEDDVEEA